MAGIAIEVADPHDAATPVDAIDGDAGVGGGFDDEDTGAWVSSSVRVTAVAGFLPRCEGIGGRTGSRSRSGGKVRSTSLSSARMRPCVSWSAVADTERSSTWIRVTRGTDAVDV